MKDKSQDVNVVEKELLTKVARTLANFNLKENSDELAKAVDYIVKKYNLKFVVIS